MPIGGLFFCCCACVAPQIVRSNVQSKIAESLPLLLLPIVRCLLPAFTVLKALYPIIENPKSKIQNRIIESPDLL
jgi:hypothetical protein